MGCIRAVLRIILYPFGYVFGCGNKKQKQPRTMFGMHNAHTEASSSLNSVEDESESCPQSSDVSHYKERSQKETSRGRRESRRLSERKRAQKKNRDTYDSEESGTDYEKKTPKRKVRNIRGESIIIGESKKNRKGSRKEGYESVFTFQDDFSESLVSLDAKANRRKLEGRFTRGHSDRDSKGLERNRFVSRDGRELTDYSLIIENYVGDTAEEDAAGAYGRKNYSILLKNRMREYIESMNLHNNHNFNFFE